jgi:FAD/FMN-containing dehydrogenase
LNAELGRAGQWLPLDPPDDGRATIGGIVATGMAGAQSYGYGPPRGYVIGMRVALADGRLVKAGGRVVKNVAGYDLCKLFTGSYGTLGLILELTFKLRPRPKQEMTVIAAASRNTLLQSAQTVLDAQLLPVAAELLSPRMARALNLPDGENDCALLIRFAGTEQAVAYQTERASALLTQSGAETVNILSADGELWRGVAAMPVKQAQQLAWRASVRPTELESFIDAVADDAGGNFSSALWHAGVGDGRVRVVSELLSEPGTCVASLKRLRERARAVGGSLVIESAPPEVKAAMDVWGDAGASVALMQRVKQQLDPEDTLSPGRFIAEF